VLNASASTNFWFAFAIAPTAVRRCRCCCAAPDIKTPHSRCVRPPLMLLRHRHRIVAVMPLRWSPKSAKGRGSGLRTGTFSPHVTVSLLCVLVLCCAVRATAHIAPHALRASRASLASAAAAPARAAAAAARECRSRAL
jgi:hypothetical protein